MAQHDPHNKMFSLAAAFIEQTSRTVFLTGRAGTGKTTFLKYIRETTFKQTAVIAPTGVAAINAGGSTIHSFFQLPFTPYVPESTGISRDERSVDKHHLLGRIKMNKERRKILQQLELLIVDEISMVRCDVLDAVDTVLRHFRQRYHEPFGGVQLLFIGDMYQLPPVVQDNEWQVLSPCYNSPFFFDSKVLQLEQPVHIELDKIYRQNEQQFIDLLNKVRNNEMDEAAFGLLNGRHDPYFEPAKEDGYITLTTHNYKADAINNGALDKLTGTVMTYKAVITGDFSEKSYPAEEMLQVKKGAQVMMIKNDVEKRYYNGKIGVITKLDKETVYVQCGDEPEVEIKKEKWENIRYTIDQSSQRVTEEVTGTFEQFPLRLAWAITIHKSQGLTFQKAVIDAGAAFAPGQVYVALSRCTTLSGIILKSRITGAGLYNDARIVAFSEKKTTAATLAQRFDISKKIYQSALLQSLFVLDTLKEAANELQQYSTSNSGSFNEEAPAWVDLLQENLQQLQTVSEKFQLQLDLLLAEEIMPEQHEHLQERLKAAAVYFTTHLRQLEAYLASCTVTTDSKQKAMVYNMMLQEVHNAVAQKLYIMEGLQQGFDAEVFNRYKKNFVLHQLRINVYAAANKQYKTETAYPYLYQQLRLLRDTICSEKGIPVYLVASGATLEELCRYLPQTMETLEQISGFGKAKVESYGRQFLDVINEYTKERGLVSLIHEKTPKKERKEKDPAKEKKDTKLETYKLYRAGKTIEAIAADRNLSATTIEGHLAYYVSNGSIPVEELISREKILLIEPVVNYMERASVSPAKQQLGDAASYGEIRLVIASLEYLRNKDAAAKEA